jgi:hypothetical protein
MDWIDGQSTFLKRNVQTTKIRKGLNRLLMQFTLCSKNIQGTLYLALGIRW